MKSVWPDNVVADRHEKTGKWVLHYLTDEQAAQCSAAMRPQVSEGDEAVAREICKTPCVKYGDGQYGFVYADVLSVLKRHRQPTAVSADAVGQPDSDFEFQPNETVGRRRCFTEEQLEARDNACRLDGARKMQEENKRLREAGEAFIKALRDNAQLSRYGGRIDIAPRSFMTLEKAEDMMLAALSPETVCGGENHG